jgi:hypothetical protein
MMNMHSAQEANENARAQFIHGKTFLQLAGLKYHDKRGQFKTYSITQFKRDLQNGHIQPRQYVHSVRSAIELEQATIQAQRELSDMVESAFGISQGSDPLTDAEALAGEDAEEWSTAIYKEIDDLIALNCWTLKSKTEKPGHKKVYRGKLVLKSKPPANSQPGRKKARYVISDPKFLQKLQDVDCFSPMARLETVRWLLSTCVERNWSLCHTDVRNAFPNAMLPEPVWMEVPKVMIARAEKYDKEHGTTTAQEMRNSYCYVTRALYGLGHSPRCFNKHLDEYFRKNGWESSDADSCLYVKYDTFGKVACAAVTFVDDALVAGTEEACQHYRAFMKAGYDISDLGEPTDFLGMEIKYDHHAQSIKVWQEKYITKMAQRYGIKYKKVLVPMPYDKRLVPREEGEAAADESLFRSKVGAIQYAAVCCRPDVCHAVRELAKHMVSPSELHMKAADQCLQYLFYTKTIGLTYVHGSWTSVEGSPCKNELAELFTDASYGEDIVTRKSTSGYATIKNGAAVTWGCKGQDKIALSSGDAELRALSECMREGIWIRKLIRTFSDDPTVRNRHAPIPPLRIWEDNRSTIKWVENPCAHSKVKHIDIPLKAIRNAATIDNEFSIKWVDTHNQLADCFTKSLSPKIHARLVMRLLNCADFSFAAA